MSGPASGAAPPMSRRTMAFTSRECGTLEGRWIVIPEDLKDVRETIRLAMEQLGPSAGIEDIRRAYDAVYGEMLPLPVGGELPRGKRWGGARRLVGNTGRRARARCSLSPWRWLLRGERA